MNVSAINAVTPQKAQNVNFSGLADGVANVLGKVGNSDVFVKGMDKIGNSKNLMTNLSTASSAVTTGLYIYKNLTDKKKSKNEKITMALNQALTFAVSTALTYTVVGALKGTTNKLAGKFGELMAKKGGKSAKEMEMLQAGARNAIDLVICSSINRFITPVAITPVANKLGAKLTDKLDARDAAKAQKLNQNA